MNNSNSNTMTFYNTPLGAKHRAIPYAKLASAETSKELVPEHSEDAFFFRMLEERGIRLNAPQIKAVRHNQGPLLTLAGAGSGKTSVLVCRTGYLLTLHNVAPENILLVTFTKKAAMEMQERLGRLPGLSRSIARRIQASTFHSFFLKLIRHKGHTQEILGSERHKQIIVKRILKEMNLGDAYQPEELLSQLSAYKMNSIPLTELPDRTPAEKEQKQVFERYEQWKQEAGKIDYDDILLIAYNLLKQTPSLLRSLQNRFTYVMVDEFQDTNDVQYQLIQMLASVHQNLFVVGDDDQTIYTFNGARNEFILDFDNKYPLATTVTLDVNYRSTSGIVGLGNEVIARNEARKKKTLQSTKTSELPPQFWTPATTDEEAEGIIAHIEAVIAEGTRQYQDIAILHRTASSSRAMFEQLALRNLPFIPYSQGDQNFYEHYVVKPVVDHLRLAISPRDFDAMSDVISTLFLNKDRAMDYIWNQELQHRKKYPLIHLLDFPDTKSYQKAKIKERISYIKSLSELKPAVVIKSIRTQFYDKYIEATDRQVTSAHKETIKETLDELEASAKRFERVDEFIQFIDMMIAKQKEIESLQRETQANAISLMTIHRSKGLEFPIVYLIGASEGILPHSSAMDADKLKDKVSDAKDDEAKLAAAMEEERRLAYVAITRAMEELYISSPAFYRGKKSEVSRFLLAPYGVQDTKKSLTAKPAIQAQVSKKSTSIQPVAARNRTLSPGQQSFKKGSAEPELTSTETVLAWLCTADSCDAWVRIATFNDSSQPPKSCPLCKSMMRKGTKEVKTTISVKYHG